MGMGLGMGTDMGYVVRGSERTSGVVGSLVRSLAPAEPPQMKYNYNDSVHPLGQIQVYINQHFALDMASEQCPELANSLCSVYPTSLSVHTCMYFTYPTPWGE